MSEYSEKEKQNEREEERKEERSTPEQRIAGRIPNSILQEIFAGTRKADASMLGTSETLAPSIAAKMSRAFGMDVSGVKISRSKDMEGTGMKGLTQGNRVILSPDVDLNTLEGQAILGHELSHVHAQAQGIGMGHVGLLQDASLEHQADVEGMRAARGLSITQDTMDMGMGMNYGFGMAGVEGVQSLTGGISASAAAPMQAFSLKFWRKKKDKKAELNDAMKSAAQPDQTAPAMQVAPQEGGSTGPVAEDEGSITAPEIKTSNKITLIYPAGDKRDARIKQKCDELLEELREMEERYKYGKLPDAKIKEFMDDCVETFTLVGTENQYAKVTYVKCATLLRQTGRNLNSQLSGRDNAETGEKKQLTPEEKQQRKKATKEAGMKTASKDVSDAIFKIISRNYGDRLKLLAKSRHPEKIRENMAKFLTSHREKILYALGNDENLAGKYGDMGIAIEEFFPGVYDSITPEMLLDRVGGMEGGSGGSFKEQVSREKTITRLTKKVSWKIIEKYMPGKMKKNIMNMSGEERSAAEKELQEILNKNRAKIKDWLSKDEDFEGYSDLPILLDKVLHDLTAASLLDRVRANTETPLLREKSTEKHNVEDFLLNKIKTGNEAEKQEYGAKLNRFKSQRVLRNVESFILTDKEDDTRSDIGMDRDEFNKEAEENRKLFEGKNGQIQENNINNSTDEDGNLDLSGSEDYMYQVYGDLGGLADKEEDEEEWKKKQGIVEDNS